MGEYVETPIKRLLKDDNKGNLLGWVDHESVKESRIQPDPNGGFFVTKDLKRRCFLANNYLFQDIVQLYINMQNGTF